DGSADRAIVRDDHPDDPRPLILGLSSPVRRRMTPGPASGRGPDWASTLRPTARRPSHEGPRAGVAIATDPVGEFPQATDQPEETGNRRPSEEDSVPPPQDRLSG